MSAGRRCHTVEIYVQFVEIRREVVSTYLCGSELSERAFYVRWVGIWQRSISVLKWLVVGHTNHFDTTSTAIENEVKHPTGRGLDVQPP